MSYQSSGLVVVKVRQGALQRGRVTRVVLLSLPRVDEARRELVAVLGVVAAADPLPVGARRRRRPGPGPGRPPSLRAARSSPAAAAARGDATFATRPAHAVHDAGRQRRVDERRLPAACTTPDVRRWPSRKSRSRLITRCTF